MDLVFDSSLSAITLAFFSIFFFYYLFFYRSSSKEVPIVEGAWPIVGHLPLLRPSNGPTHKILGELANKYGSIFSIKFGSKRALVISNWEIAKECFTKLDLQVSDRPKLEATQHIGYNGAMFALAPHGSYWRQVRKIATVEIFSHRRMEQLQHFHGMVVRNSIKNLYNVWCRKENKSSNYVPVELKQLFGEVVSNIVIPMLVGKRSFGAASVIDKEEAEICKKMLKEMSRLVGLFTVGDAFPFLKWFDFGGHVRAMKKISKEMDKILDDLLENHRCQTKTSSEKDLDPSRHDFMDVMLSLLDGKAIEGFDCDTTIKATILTLFAGGVETTSTTLVWAISLLLNNPLVMEKAKIELNIQVGKNRCVEVSDIGKLVYLQVIIKEVLRLYPPLPVSIPREFSEDCTLAGHEIKKGTRLFHNIWKMHIDPNVWSDPLDFKPERFLTTHKDIDVKGHHFELLPFGCGRRICPRISFGHQMLHLTIASFLHSFEISKPSTEPIDMTVAFGISNTKATPLEVLVKPRLPSKCYDLM